MSLRHGDSETLEIGVLVQYLHGELDDAGAQAVARHVAACDACRSAVASLEAGMRRATSVLAAATWTQPSSDEWNAVLDSVRQTIRRRQRQRRMRIAAGWILAIGAAASMASAPVRAWIAERLAFDRAQPAPPAAAADPSGGKARLSFVPAGSQLTISIATTQAGGTLTVVFTDGERAAIEVTRGGTEHLTWTGDGVRIANEAPSDASYEITVSRSIERVSVRIGESEPLRFDRPTAGRDPIAVELRTGAVRNATAHDEE